MLRVLLLAGACASAAFGQFTSLAVTDDASQVYFRTDLRLKSERASRNGGVIYRLSGGVLERLTTPGNSSEPYDSDSNPQVSGDGSIFSYTHYQNCVGGSSCISRPTVSTSYLTVRGKPYGTPLDGEAQISRSGRYVLSALLFGMTFPLRENVVVLRDLQSGSAADVPLRPAGSRQAVTSDGRVLAFTATGGLTLWKPGSAPALPVQDNVTTAIVNDAGSWVIYTRGYGAGEVRTLEVASQRDLPLTGGDHQGFSPSISNDGALVLYLSAGQVALVRPDGSGRRQLTRFSEQVDEAVLSGDGRVAVVVTGGRLVEVDTASGNVRELIGRTPVCRLEFTALTPGSVLPIRGSAMSTVNEVASAPLPSRLGGLSVTADGAPLPLLSVSPTEIWFQVPFNMPVGSTPTIAIGEPSLFNGCAGGAAQVVNRAPYFFGGGGLTAAHQDFSGLVTSQSPAKPGEVLTFWGVGLGAVTPELPTGVTTPLAPLFRLAGGFECHSGPLTDGPGLEVLFAGLAPSMIGIYQVSVRMPDPPPDTGFVFVNCGTPGNPTERHGGLIPVAP